MNVNDLVNTPATANTNNANGSHANGTPNLVATPLVVGQFSLNTALPPMVQQPMYFGGQQATQQQQASPQPSPQQQPLQQQAADPQVVHDVWEQFVQQQLQQQPAWEHVVSYTFPQRMPSCFSLRHIHSIRSFDGTNRTSSIGSVSANICRKPL